MEAPMMPGRAGRYLVDAGRAFQQARLDAALREAGVDPAATRPTAALEERTVPYQAYRDIGSTAGYLAWSHGVTALPPVLAAHVTSREDIPDLAARVGLRSEPAPLDSERGTSASLARGTEVRLDGATIYRVGYTSGSRTGAGQLSVVPGTTLLRVPVTAETLTSDFGPLAVALYAGLDDGRAELPPNAAHLVLLDDAGNRRGSLIVLDISLQGARDVPSLRYLEGLLLLDGPGTVVPTPGAAVNPR
jgi:hypothetical protein